MFFNIKSACTISLAVSLLLGLLITTAAAVGKDFTPGWFGGSSALSTLKEKFLKLPLSWESWNIFHKEEDSDDFIDGDDKTIITHWALLIAGSSSWFNYRHQADVSHAYQVLRRGGYSSSHIVVMVFDDIAFNPANPYPGKIFNRPGGPDVYSGITPDYKGSAVNAETFLAVLAGDAKAVEGKGSGKVINSGPDDRVFVFYSDHGAPGLLGMPSGSPLYADQLINTIHQKYNNRGFKEMALYIEACESGSIFEGLLDVSLPVYAVTASNGHESSWGTYCPNIPGMDSGTLDTCMGDLFSVSWMENADETDLTHETLLKQFLRVRKRTSDNFTYNMGSHVLQFGRLTIQREEAGDYEGTLNRGITPSLSSQGSDADDSKTHGRELSSVSQRDADLIHLKYRYSTATDSVAKELAKVALDVELARRRAVDAAVNRVAARLLQFSHFSEMIITSLNLRASQVFTRGGAIPQRAEITAEISPSAADNAMILNPEVISMLVSRALPGRSLRGVPVVDSFDCLRGMVQQWQETCLGGSVIDQYTMKHTRFLANLCNAGLLPEDIFEVLEGSGCQVILTV